MTPAETASATARDNAVSADRRPQAEDVGPERGTLASCDRPAAVESSPASASKTGLLELAYTEYLRREEEGENPDIEAFCARFPPCRSALRRMLRLDQLVQDHPECLGRRRKVRWPEAGEQHGDLTLLRELGRGTFARVFLATEASTGDRLVAVKFSSHSDAEARTQGRLSHPHIVPILSAHREEATGLTVVRMPYLGSATLEDVCDRVWTTPPHSGGGERGRVSAPRERPRPRKAAVILDVIRACAQPEDPPAASTDPRLRKGGYTDGVIHVAVQLAETLAFLHEQGVCHRDLKPSNVLLDPSGKPLLLDFNLSTSARELALHTGGTLAYMAPEQIHAFLNNRADGLDERGDLFALGVIVYELLTGSHPHGPVPSNLPPEVLARRVLERQQSGFRPSRRVCPDLERPVAAVLDRCLALAPADRPASAAELAVELRRQFSPARRLRRWLAARPGLVLATICLLALTAALAGFAWSVTPPYSAREYQRGMTAYRAGDYDEAEKHFDCAVRADPSNPRLRFARGCARLKQSKYRPDDSDKLNQAWDDLKPIPEGPPDVPTLAVKAYIQTRKASPREAIPKYNQLAEAGYQPVMVLNNRAYSYIQQEQFDEARRDLDEAAQLDPNCQAVFYNRAMLAGQRRWRLSNSSIPLQALDDMEHALRLGPASAILYRDAALLYAQAACDDLNRAPVSLDAPIVTALHFQSREQRIERALFLLHQAIANGEPSSTTEHFLFRLSLRSHPVFADLGRMKPQRTAPAMELRLIDPIDLPD